MISNIIQNKKYRDFTVKIVTGSEDQAADLCADLEDYINENNKLKEKLEVGLGLEELKINDIFNSVIINYKFNTTKDAKHFSMLFSDILEDNYSNLEQAILYFEKEINKKQSTYDVSLSLPKDIEKAFELQYINSVTTQKYPSIKITRDMLSSNGKKVILVLEDFTNELIAIKLTKNSDTLMLPQQWLDIEEKALLGIYDTKWVMDINNFIRIEDGNIVSKNKSGDEVVVAQEFIKLDGSKSKFIENGGLYIDVQSELTVPKDIIILN